MLYPFIFQPILKERIWGGHELERLYQKNLPPRAPIGESWEISDRPGDASVIANGPLAGKDLRWLMENHAAEILGDAKPAAAGRFPLLCKILDAREKLSLQVHPPTDKAKKLKGEPKTEMWFITDAAPDASLYVGLKRGVTRAEFEKKIADGGVADCFHRIPVKAGDAMFLPSGRVHAIGDGLVIFEIQQNSDTTYRVYDWGRVGLDGRPRQLHIEQSLRSIDWNDFEPVPVRGAPTSGVIADCAEFTIRRVVLGAGERMSVAAGEQPRLVSVASGSVRAGANGSGSSRAPFGQLLAAGENVLLPFAGAFTFAAASTAILLVTENFA